MVSKRALKRYIDRRVHDGIREMLQNGVQRAGQWARENWHLMLPVVAVALSIKLFIFFKQKAYDEAILAGQVTPGEFVREIKGFVLSTGKLRDNPEALAILGNTKTIDDLVRVFDQFGLDSKVRAILLKRKSLFEQRKLYRNAGLTGAVNAMYNPREI